jgi:predicted lipid-binding transport protein (Tim44 family)
MNSLGSLLGRLLGDLLGDLLGGLFGSLFVGLDDGSHLFLGMNGLLAGGLWARLIQRLDGRTIYSKLASKTN